MKLLLILLFLSSCATSRYRDGEGNVIPKKAVRLLVQSEFAVMTPKEDSTIQKHFYFHNQK